MSNRTQIERRVVQAAEKALFDHHYVSAVDVLINMGLLQPVHVQDWRKGSIPFLEQVIQGNLNKITFTMKCFRSWAREKGLKPSQTQYLARTSGPKRELRFSKSGDPQIEAAYQTHYISPLLSEKKQQRLQEKSSQPPELVVFLTVKDSVCSRCKKELPRGSFLLMEASLPLCMNCAGLNELIFLPSGDPGLTRYAKKISNKSAVVVKFSRTRKRYERQGIFVEVEALEKARNRNGLDDLNLPIAKARGFW
jgi:hypothetical protein